MQRIGGGRRVRQDDEEDREKRRIIWEGEHFVRTCQWREKQTPAFLKQWFVCLIACHFVVLIVCVITCASEVMWLVRFICFIYLSVCGSSVENNGDYFLYIITTTFHSKVRLVTGSMLTKSLEEIEIGIKDFFLFSVISEVRVANVGVFYP